MFVWKLMLCGLDVIPAERKNRQALLHPPLPLRKSLCSLAEAFSVKLKVSQGGKLDAYAVIVCVS